MKKLFLLLAFTGVIGTASATSIVALTKGVVIALVGDDKKQEGKKKCDKKKTCCKSQTAQSPSGCSAGKEEAKTCSHEGKTETKSCCKAKGSAKDVAGDAKSNPAAGTTTPSVK